MFVTIGAFVQAIGIAMVIAITCGVAPVSSEPCPTGVYTSWLPTYVAALRALPSPLTDKDLSTLGELATAQPCSPSAANDDDYLAWFALWTNEMHAPLERYKAVIDDLAKTSEIVRAHDVIAAAKPTVAETRRIAALAVVRPTASARGYAAWCKPFASFVTTAYSAGGQSIGAAAEADGTLNEAETALLAMYAAAEPNVSGDGTLPQFLDVYLPLLKRVAKSPTPATIEQRTFLEIVGKIAPQSTSEADFLAWFAVFDSMLASETESRGELREFQNDNRDLARIFLQAVRPINAGGDHAYNAWFAAFTRRLKLAIGGAEPEVNMHEAEVLNVMTSVRPCGRAGAHAIYSRIASMRDSWIRAGGAVLGGILDHAAPVPCKAQ